MRRHSIKHNIMLVFIWMIRYEGRLQWRSQDSAVGGTEGLGDGSPPAWCRGRVSVFSQRAHVTVDSTAADVLKHEKNLGCSACLFAMSKPGRVTIQKL